MQKVSRQEIFAQASKKLRSDFEELKATIPHAATKGSEGEKLIRQFLNGHLPQRFKAAGGFIIDHKDQVSKQTDVVIYDALNCPTYRASEDASIFPADNVAAVIEVKSSLDKEKLFEAADSIALAKSLVKTPVQDLPILIQSATLGCVFAFESPLTLGKISEHYVENIRRFGGLGRHIDLIGVLDVGLLTLTVQMPGLPGWAPVIFEGPGGEQGEGTHVGVGAVPLGAATVDAFLRFLLPHLTFFRGMVDHPGFNWAEMGGDSKITYLTSITHESDPKKREQRKAEYRRQVIEAFKATPLPPDWQGNKKE